MTLRIDPNAAHTISGVADSGKLITIHNRGEHPITILGSPRFVLRPGQDVRFERAGRRLVVAYRAKPGRGGRRKRGALRIHRTTVLVTHAGAASGLYTVQGGIVQRLGKGKRGKVHRVVATLKEI